MRGLGLINLEGCEQDLKTMYRIECIGIEEKEKIIELCRGVFTGEPWNDDWSDDSQLDLYIQDLIGQDISLTYGMYENDELIGISMGYIKHWFTGTEYYINELCIKTDKQGIGAGTYFIGKIEDAIKNLGFGHIFLQTGADVPAYRFYKKNGFSELESQGSFVKEL